MTETLQFNLTAQKMYNFQNDSLLDQFVFDVNPT